MANDAARAMFSTWKYDSETNQVQDVGRSFDPITARSSSHEACDRCHDKKIKCSGEKDGCERCIANQLLCEYTRSGTRPSRKSKKGSQHASDRGEASSSHGRLSRSSRRHRDAPGSSQAPPGHHADPAYALEDVDRYLSPEDAFDMNLITAPAATTVGYVTTTAASEYPAGVAVSPYGTWQAQGYAATGTSADVAASYTMTSAHGYEVEYEGYQGYEDYPNVDPRYWSRGR